MRLLFVHGRSQGGRSSAELRAEWTGALGVGLARAGLELPDGVKIDVPFYGNELDEWARKTAAKPDADLKARGATGDEGFEEFFVKAADDIIQEKDVKDDQLLEIARDELGDEISDDDLKERGIQNWRSVRILARTLDWLFPDATEFTIRQVLYDVYIYLEEEEVWKAIHQIVRAEMTDEPTVVISHSLGTVVAYRMLMGNPMSNLKQLVTLGSPLGINPVAMKMGQFLPHVPASDRNWYNALDTRDIVALRALTANSFPTNPPITNNDDIDNHTANRHGISGYLGDANVAKEIYIALTT